MIPHSFSRVHASTHAFAVGRLLLINHALRIRMGRHDHDNVDVNQEESGTSNLSDDNHARAKHEFNEPILIARSPRRQPSHMQQIVHAENGTENFETNVPRVPFTLPVHGHPMYCGQQRHPLDSRHSLTHESIVGRVSVPIQCDPPAILHPQIDRQFIGDSSHVADNSPSQFSSTEASYNHICSVCEKQYTSVRFFCKCWAWVYLQLLHC